MLLHLHVEVQNYRIAYLGEGLFLFCVFGEFQTPLSKTWGVLGHTSLLNCNDNNDSFGGQHCRISVVHFGRQSPNLSDGHS